MYLIQEMELCQLHLVTIIPKRKLIAGGMLARDISRRRPCYKLLALAVGVRFSVPVRTGRFSEIIEVHDDDDQHFRAFIVYFL
jgi:hypothetical protein